MFIFIYKKTEAKLLKIVKCFIQWFNSAPIPNSYKPSYILSLITQPWPTLSYQEDHDIKIEFCLKW